ncbi:hypothetical protein Bhyg_05417, partial [Pseudolycoriella hygida]
TTNDTAECKQQEGYSGNPHLTSSRVVNITMLLFSVLIIQYYASFIVGSLLTEAPKNIKTVEQLLHIPFKFGVDAVPYVIDNFHVAKDEATVKLYQKVMKNPEEVIMPLRTGIRLIKQGGFVFNTDGSYAYIILRNSLTDSEKCELQEILYIPKFPTGPAVPNKSPLRELIRIKKSAFDFHLHNHDCSSRWYVNFIRHSFSNHCNSSKNIKTHVSIALLATLRFTAMSYNWSISFLVEEVTSFHEDFNLPSFHLSSS